ncbi:MAG: TrpB-like pyridoxal phosphate-dependent enzyme [Lachnospiraceae bacterium]|jgi:tryptophan synthase beta chain
MNKNKEIPYKIYIEENEMPSQWYNVRADMKNKPAPLLNPQTHRPMTHEDLAPVFCDELIKQELDDTTAYFDIPDEILKFYKMYRPSPLVRAYCLEETLQTPAKIYYKFEGNNTSGSHKLNSAIAQAYYAKNQGLKGVTTETGAGQWGTALAMACGYLGLDCKVFMVKCSYEQKPFRREVMRTYGASVTPSPSDTTAIGRAILAKFPETSGSLGCAISEAVEVATQNEGYRYVLGSVLNQVLLHQSIIGLESKIAMDKYGIKPDIIIGCAGGGSNLGGLISPFMGEMLRGEAEYEFIAVEPESCPSFTRGKYAYDFCDTGMICPLAKMYTLGSGFIPSSSHAGGLRFHGMSTVLSQLYDDGFMSARAVGQTEVFQAAVEFARCEGTLPAPESAHAIKVAVDEAISCRETGEEKTIFFGLTGTGYFDLGGYGKFADGELTDYVPTDEDIAKGFANLPAIN